MPQAPQSDKEINFARMREKERRLESQLEQQQSLIQQMSSQLNQIQQSTQRPEPSFFEKYGFEEGGFVESDKLARALQEERRDWEKSVDRMIESRAKQVFEQQEKSRFAEKLRSRYPDYDRPLLPIIS